MNLKRYEQNVGYSQLDSLVETLGEKGLLSYVVEKLSRGISPSMIAGDLSLPFMVLWEWIEADASRQRAYDEGYRMYGNEIHAETIHIADSATVEDVSVQKLRVDTRFKAAANYDRKRFGNRLDVEVNHSISVMDALKEARSRLKTINGELLNSEPLNHNQLNTEPLVIENVIPINNNILIPIEAEDI